MTSMKFSVFLIAALWSGFCVANNEIAIEQEILDSGQMPNATQHMMSIASGRERMSSYFEECRAQNMGESATIKKLQSSVQQQYRSLDLRLEKWRAAFSGSLRNALIAHKPNEIDEADLSGYVDRLNLYLYKKMRSVAFYDYLNHQPQFEQRCVNLTDYIASLSDNLNHLIAEHADDVDAIYKAGLPEDRTRDFIRWSDSLGRVERLSQSPDKQYAVYFSLFNMPEINRLRNNRTGRLFLYDYESKSILESASALITSPGDSVSWNHDSVTFKNDQLPYWNLPRKIKQPSKCVSSEDKTHLKFTFNGSSQIHVSDSDGCNLAYMYHRKGDIVEVSSSKVMNVFLSNAGAVTMTLNGTPFDYEVIQDQRYVKFYVGGPE